ncbi:MAG: hypothetical protein HY040_08485 [Planctomycetes bacterium]|nr:hypothetical protein [Planctomycetota bacterium]
MTKSSWLRVAPLLFLGLGGCAVLQDTSKATSWLKRTRAPALDANVVQVDVALIERPLGDDFLNKELWTHTDEMIVDIERKGVVEENGYRVGQLVGGTPAGLQTLLKSPRACINPRRRLVLSGHAVTQILGGDKLQTTFTVHQESRAQEFTLIQARFCLDVTAVLTSDGKTRLCFTPKVETGETMFPYQPDPDKSTWTMNVDRPCRTFKNVSWEVTVAPGEFLVIGARNECENTLGHRSFVEDEGANRVQRLLVIRTSRSPAGGDTGEPTLEDLARASHSPCLAVQAGMTSVRASGQK